MRATRSLLPGFVLSHDRRGVRRGRFPAATLLADIRGFTTLTERLMARGKEGAEVLTGVLNSVFAPLVGEVHRRGGFVSAFAGDALTAVFPLRREGARWQALSAGAAIRDHVKSAGRVTTPLGPFELAVRVGVSAGEVAWGIVGGEERRAYFVRGPAIDSAARAERTASTGEIVADARAIAGIEERLTLEAADGPGQHRRVREVAVAPRPRRVRAPEFGPEAARPFVPPEVLMLEEEGEFREVCAVFLSFEEPARHRDLDAFAVAVLRRCEAYGGTLNKLDFGDKGGVMLLLFGAPVAHEDDARRACRLLLDLREARLGARWRAGATFGAVYAGFVGGRERSEYTAIGDVVNTAARLAGSAAWGEVLLSARARDALGDAFEVAPRGTLSLKGKAEPVACFRLEARGAGGEAHAFQGAMVGRRREREAIEAFLSPLGAGRFAGVVHVTGEPGIGKSHLAFEVCRRLAGRCVWLRGEADEVLPRPFGPFRRMVQERLLPPGAAGAEERRGAFDAGLEALRVRAAEGPGGADERVRAVLAELDRTAPVLAALLDLPAPGALWSMLDPQGRHENSVMALTAFLRAESLAAPLVVELEDGHALDGASREVVAAVARGAGEFPLALLVTSRLADDGTRPPLGLDGGVPVLEVDLDRMGAQDLAELAALELGAPPGPRLLALLPERTRGNPFFVLQLLRHLREHGRLERGEAGWELAAEATGVPETIQAILAARIDRLSSGLKAAVKAAAVIGRTFEVGLLSRVLGRDVTPLLAEGRDEQVWAVSTEAEHAFRHAMLRDVAYEMQLGARRRELHVRAARAIESVHGTEAAPRFADIAWHYEHGGDADRAVPCLLRAIAHAKQEYQNHAAIGLGDRLLRLAGTEARWAEARGTARLQQAEVLTLVGRAAEAVVLAEEVRREALAAQSAALCMQACIASGSALQDLGRYDEAIARYRESRAQAERRGDRKGAASALGNEGECHRLQGRFAEASACYEAARAVDEAIGNAEGVQRHANNIGIIHAMRGEDDSALASFESGLSAASAAGDEAGEARARTNLAILLRRMGRFGAAAEHYDRALALATELGDRRLQAMVTGNMGNLLMVQGAWERAASFHARAHAISREIGDKAGEVRARGNLAITLGKRGEDATAHAHFAGAVEDARRLGARDLEAFFAHEYARFLLARGDADGASLWGGRARASATEIGYAAIDEDARGLAARIALALGEDGAVESARAVEAALADEATAAELAHAIWRRTHEDPDLARARWRYGRLVERGTNPALEAELADLRGPV